MRTKTIFPAVMVSILASSSSIYAESTLKDAKPFEFTSRVVAESSAADCSSMNTPITEKQRIFVSKDGHLESNGKRIRLYGTNISSIPAKSDAAYWAKVLASQGFNCIRWHHFDSNWTNCFLKYDQNGKYSYNWDKIDDFDYFYNELKNVGIYSNINMLVGRDVKSPNGYPKELDSLDWKERHALGFWNEEALDMQKDYANTILTHKNPYTNLTYAEDPATAIVEINNENGLMMSFLNGTLDKYPKNILQELEDKWNVWLKENNYSLSSLQKEFNRAEKVGKIIVSKSSSFNIEQNENAKADLRKTNKGCVVTVKKNGTQGWHVQLDQSSWPVESNKIYTLTFRAKASKPSTISVNVMMDHSPWSNLNFNQNISLTTKFQDYKFTISNFTADKKARLTFSNMGLSEGTTFTFEDISLDEGGDVIEVKAGAKANSVALPSYTETSGFSYEYKKIIMNFLYNTEHIYWHTMHSYIKNDLNVKSLMMGTICGCTTQGMMSEFDIIDSHSYWHHPYFPQTSWDMSHYLVENEDMATSTTGGILSGLAVQRIYGKPFSVTEYDHPYPNQYNSEMLPMLSTYACLQDWDCIFSFAYELSQKGENESTRISGYFDQADNPSKTPANIVASRIFRNFLVKSAEEKVFVTRTKANELEGLPNVNAWNFTSDKILNMPLEQSMVHQVGVVFGKDSADCKSQIQNDKMLFPVEDKESETESIKQKISSGENLQSDTCEITWNPQRGDYIVHANKAFVAVAHLPKENNSSVVNLKQKEIPNPTISFSPLDDFSVVAGAEYANDKFAVYSCSWSGNKFEHLRKYGEKGQRDGTQFNVVRDHVDLTTDSTLGKGPALTLASEGTLVIQSVQPEQIEAYYKNNGKEKEVNSMNDLPSYFQCFFRLFKLNNDGTRGNEVLGMSTRSMFPQTNFRMERNSGTLWYELEIIRAQD
ncbi:MAG: carbohydrate binding domain-containing protein [Treponema sp.]